MDIARLTDRRPLSDVVFCTPDMPVRDVVALLASKRIGALPVIDGARVVGIFAAKVALSRQRKGGSAWISPG